MSSLVPIVYYGGFTILFFFWIYGIVSFVFDLKNKVVPGLRQYRRGRKKQKQDDSEPSEEEKGLL